MTEIIEVYLYDTIEEFDTDVQRIDNEQGYPSPGGDTFWGEREFNNGKYLMKDSKNMRVKIGRDPVEFEYKTNYAYYIEFAFNDDILKIYTYDLYPNPFRVLDITTLSIERQEVMQTLADLIISECSDCSKVEFVRENDTILLTHGEEVIVKPLADMTEEDREKYEAVGDICNQLIEI